MCFHVTNETEDFEVRQPLSSEPIVVEMVSFEV